MTIRAYDELYLDSAQRILGDMMDFAVNTCGMEPDEYFVHFLVSSISKQFGEGNPLYVAGCTGCELFKKVILESGLPAVEQEDVMYLDKSPEYWSGWILAYYQWYTARSFQKIHRAITMEDLCDLYPVLHEADVAKAVEVLEVRYRQYYQETNLKRFRKRSGLTQAALARESGVAVRQIQLFEQRRRDINKTQAIQLLALSKVLGCSMFDLMEI